MAKYITCQVCGKKVDFNLQNCPYCKAIILASEEDAIEENDEVEVLEENAPKVATPAVQPETLEAPAPAPAAEQQPAPAPQPQTPTEPEQFEEQPSAVYDPKDAEFQPPQMQTPSFVIEQQGQNGPMVQPPPVVIKSDPDSQMRAISDNEQKKNPLGLLLALIILGGAGYYIYLHKDTLLAKKENPYGNQGQVQEQSKIVTEVNNCTSESAGYYVDGQYMYTTTAIPVDEKTVWKVMIDVTADNSKSFTSKMCTTINNEKVYEYSDLFYNRKIENLDLSSFNTSQVDAFVSMFSRTTIEILDLRGFDTTNGTKFIDMFSESEIKKLDISSFKFNTDKQYSYLFAGATIDTLILGDLELIEDSKNIEIFEGAKIKKVVATNSKTIELLREYFGEDIEIVSKE